MSHQVIGKEQSDLCPQSMKALPALGRGRRLIMSLATVNNGLLNTYDEMIDTASWEHIVSLKAFPASSEDRHIYNYATS